MTSWPAFDLPSICPQCLAHHDATSNTSDEGMPHDGDVTVCIVCTGVSVYDFSLPGKLRFPTDEELAVIADDERIQAIRWAMGVARNKLGPLQGDYWPDR